MFDPDIVLPDALDLPIDQLAGEGVEAVILDLENTLVRYKAETLPPEVIAFLDRAHGAGFRVGVVSNSPRAWVTKTLADHDIPYVGMAAKPRRSGFRRVLAALDAKPETAVHVGDQVITDVYGAHRMGMKAVLVDPIGPEGPVSTQIQRRILMPILRLTRRMVGRGR